MSTAPLSICVYCGSRHGTRPAYTTAARALGRAIGTRGWQLVYGGGKVGLMGEVADAALAAGGRVVGVIPESLKRLEVGHLGLDELHVVPTMHVRKQMMAERADVFIALPGGIGTLEELVEQLTWSQLGRHDKPVIIANIAGFWSPFLNLLAYMTADTFIRAGLEVHFKVVDEATQIVPAVLAALDAGAARQADLGVLAKF